MRALLLNRTDGPEALEPAEMAAPEPQEGNLLIEVRAAGVSFPDLLLTRGEYQLKPEPPFVPGVESAGVVSWAPEGSGFSVGDRVMAMTMLGAFAEVVSAALPMCFPIPAGLNFDQAAGFIMNYHTAHFALARRGRLAAGETLLVHGAAGGVGTAAVQVGKGLGARVLAVVSSEEKAAIASEAGADELLQSGEDWVAAAKELTDGRGVDVVFDPVGGERLESSPRCMAPEGRLLVIGFAEGSIPSLAANRILLRNIDVVGVNWGGFLPNDPALPAATHEALSAMAEAGHVNPVVGRSYPLEQAAEALADLDGRRARGKLVLSISSD
ncbi:MAG: NADPH:quinone oxidoreductase family protein [Solirubrobacterales bacterium]